MKNVTESQSSDDTNNISVITSKNIITIIFMIPSNKQDKRTTCLFTTRTANAKFH